MVIYGYARVSTDAQDLVMQLDAFKRAGVQRVVEETGSGGDRTRPKLAKLLDRLEV